MTIAHGQWNTLYQLVRNIVLACLFILLTSILVPSGYSYFIHDIPSISLHDLEEHPLARTVILYRHAERCDRSSHQCEGNKAGITVEGVKNASSIGKSLRKEFQHPYTLMSSDAVRTEQSARSFGGMHPVTINKDLDDHFCNAKEFPTFLKALESTPNRQMHIAFTHSQCLRFIAEHFEHKKMSHHYLDNLVLEIDRHNKIRVMGSLALNH